MTEDSSDMSIEPSGKAAGRGSRSRIWVAVGSTALLILFLLDYLLGLVIWLPLYSGLFGFLVAGLIAGGAAFRFARRLRPVSKGRIQLIALVLTLLNAPAALYLEYYHVATGVGELQGFGKLRVRAINAGKPRDAVVRQIEREFRSKLAAEYPPGGFIGYARWCTRSGDMGLQVEDAGDKVSVSHRGWAWVVRSMVAVSLMFVGLCFSFDGLRSAMPIRNTLSPGEDYEEIDD